MNRLCLQYKALSLHPIRSLTPAFHAKHDQLMIISWPFSVFLKHTTTYGQWQLESDSATFWGLTVTTFNYHNFISPHPHTTPPLLPAPLPWFLQLLLPYSGCCIPMRDLVGILIKMPTWCVFLPNPRESEPLSPQRFHEIAQNSVYRLCQLYGLTHFIARKLLKLLKK